MNIDGIDLRRFQVNLPSCVRNESILSHRRAA